MATAPPPKHHQPLHNFSLPFLRWGHRIQLNHHTRRNRHHRHHRNRNSPLTDSDDSDLNHRATPHRLRHNSKPKTDGNRTGNRLDAYTATADDADVRNLRPRRLTIDGENDEQRTSTGKRDGVDEVTADDGDVKPWNLRPRRLTIDAVDVSGAGASTAVTSNSKSVRLLRYGTAGAATAAAAEENEESGRKRRLWISLSKEEIEEDVYAFTGSRPARRPKKRNRTVQKHVDNVFPGLYLVGISADSYRV